MQPNKQKLLLFDTALHQAFMLNLQIYEYTSHPASYDFIKKRTRRQLNLDRFCYETPSWQDNMESNTWKWNIADEFTMTNERVLSNIADTEITVEGGREGV